MRGWQHRQKLWYQTWVLFSTPTPPRVASVSLSVKWMRNILPQPSVRLWYHPTAMRRQKMGTHTGHTDKTEEQAQLRLLGTP